MEKPEKPKNGTISIRGGKSTIVWQDKEQPFGVGFVVRQMRLAARKSRQGFYTDKIRELCRDLDSRGIFAIKDVKGKLELLMAGKDINRQYVKMVVGWLGQIEMFKHVKTGGKVKPDYGKNYDRIFTKAA